MPQITIVRSYAVEIETALGKHRINASFTRHGALRSAGYDGPEPRFGDCYAELIAAGVELGMKIKADLDACEGVTD